MPPLLPLLGFSSSWQGEFSDKKSFERSHECERDKWNGVSSWHYCYQLMQLRWVDAQPHTRFKNNECPRILCPFLSTRIEYLMFWNNSSEKVTKLCHMPGFLSDTLRIKLSQVSWITMINSIYTSLSLLETTGCSLFMRLHKVQLLDS